MATPAAVLSIIVEANTGKAKAELDRFNKGLDDKSIKVSATIDKTSFARAKQVAGSLGGKEEVELSADVDTSSFARARAAQAVLTKESGRLGDVFNRSQLSIGQWTGILAAATPVIVDMTGALGALTASAAAATAGLGALTVGGLGAATVGLAGFASVAVPATSNLKDLKTAQDAYTDAVQRYGRSSTQAETAFSKLALEQKRAGPEAAKFAANLRDLSRSWKELTKAGQANFIGLLNDGLKRTQHLLPLLAKSANKSTGALRDGFDLFLKKATGPDFKTFVHVMTDTFAKGMKPIAAGFANIGIVLERIAVAVAPDILRMVKGFREMTQGWVDSTRNAGELRDTVHELVNQANAWWKLIKATAGLIAAVLVPGMGKGKMAVEGITASIKEWTAWVEGHPAAMRDFFKEGLKTTSQLFEVLAGFLPMIFQVSKAMRPIARLFLGIVKGLNSIKVGNISALTVLLGAVVGAKLISGIGSMVGAFGRLKVAALGAATAEKAAVGVPLGAGTSAKTSTGRVIGSTGTTVAAGGRFARTKSIARGIGAAAIGTAVISGIFDAFDDKGLQRDFGMKLQDFFHGATFGLVKGSAQAAQEASQAIADVISRTRPGNVLPEDAATTVTAAGKIKGLTDATLRLVRIRSQLLPQLVREGSLTQDQADALAKYAKQQERVLRNSQEFMSGRSKGLGFAHALAQDKKLTGDEVADILRKLSELPKGARKEAANTMIGMAKVMEDKGDLPKGSARGLRDTVVKTYHGMNVKSVKESGKMAKGVAMNAGALVGAVTAGLEILKGNVQKSLKAFGVKALKFTLTKPGQAGGALGSWVGALTQQRGGLIPGVGDGDKVRVLAEPGEGFINKKAVKAMGGKGAIDRINKAVPRQGGGVIDRTGVQHLAKGGMAAMTAEANRFEAKQFPYSWGGGHGGFGIQPVDCSGAVSDILHAGGLLNAPMVSGALANWGKPGKGALTVYANPEHTFMSLAGKYFGTSSTNPGGGAGWMGDPGAGYRAGFAARTMEVTGAAAMLKRILLKGPDGPLKDMGQSALDKARRAGNKYIESKMPSGAFGGGQSLADFAKGPGKIVGASVYGFGEPGTGTVGASGVSLPGKPAFAELDMGTALGHLPFGKKLKITVGPKTAIGEKLDIGAGGGSVGGHHRSIDFWRDLAEKLGLSGTFLGLAKVQGLQEGGIAGPYVGSFARGGEVAKDGLAKVHKGEHVTPKHQPHQKFGPIPGLKQLLKVLRLAAFGRHAEHRLEVLRDKKHLTLEQRSEKRDLQRRKQEARLARQLRHGAGGPGAIQKALKALAKSRVTFGPKAVRQLKDLEMQRRHHNLDRGERRQLHNLEDRKAESKRDDKIEKRLRDRLALEKELIAEFRTLHAELKEHNKLARTVRANEKAALNAVVNLTASQIGAQGMQKGRNASPGRAVRY